MKRRSILFTGIICACAAIVSAGVSVTTTVDGDDWWLPADVPVSPAAGLYWLNPSRATSLSNTFAVNDGNFHYGMFIQFSWRQINPSQGVYNWSAIDTLIAKIANAPADVGFILWPCYSDFSTFLDYTADGGQGDIPAWVRSTYNIVRIQDNWSDATQSYARFADGIRAWDPACEWEEAWEENFLKPLAARYKNHPRLIAAEMRACFEPYSGEWYWKSQNPGTTDDEFFDELQGQHGKSKTVFKQQFTAWAYRFTDAWATEFGGWKKLIAMSSNTSWSTPLSEELLPYVFSKGGGNRDGGPSTGEIWYAGYGNHLTADGHIHIDRNFNAGANPYTTGAFSGSEITEFDPSKNWVVPGQDWDYQRFRMGVAYELVKGRNWASHSDYVWSNYRPMIDWEIKELGKTNLDAPDAFCHLLEIGYNGTMATIYSMPTQTVRNHERGLMQYDIAGGGTTVPTQLMPDTAGCRKNFVDYLARRTNVATGNRNIYFMVDREWMTGGPNPVLIKISFTNASGSAWHLEYSNGTTVISSANITTTTGAAAWKTVTFDISDFKVNAHPFAAADSMDFRIAVTGSSDLTVNFARVVKPVYLPSTTTPQPSLRPTRSEHYRAPGATCFYTLSGERIPGSALRPSVSRGVYLGAVGSSVRSVLYKQ